MRVPPIVAEFVYSGVYGISVIQDAMRDTAEYSVLMREEKEVLAQEVQRLRKESSASAYDAELIGLLSQERDALLEEVGAPARAVAQNVRGTVVDHRSLFTQSIFSVRLTSEAVNEVSVGGSVETLTGVPVGVVREVFDTIAVVTPYSGMTEPFEVHFGSGSTTIHAQAVGRGVATVVARLPRDIPVSIGTPVYVDGAPVPLGVVQEQNAVPENAEQDIYVRLSVDARSLSHVRFAPPVVSVETVTPLDV